jgi:hypothetical protein
MHELFSLEVAAWPCNKLHISTPLTPPPLQSSTHLQPSPQQPNFKLSYNQINLSRQTRSQDAVHHRPRQLPQRLPQVRCFHWRRFQDLWLLWQRTFEQTSLYRKRLHSEYSPAPFKLSSSTVFCDGVTRSGWTIGSQVYFILVKVMGGSGIEMAAVAYHNQRI